MEVGGSGGRQGKEGGEEERGVMNGRRVNKGERGLGITYYWIEVESYNILIDLSGSWTAGAFRWRVNLTSGTSSISDSSDSVSNM